MTAADICTGTPRTEGRYLVFVRCASPQVSDWVEPIIMTWNGKWITTYLTNKIVGWIGPIPVMKVEDIAGKGIATIESPSTEYDL